MSGPWVPSRAMRRLTTIVAALVLACLVVAPASGASVRAEFIGMFVSSPLMEETGTLDPESAAMAEAGVGSVRVVFDWRSAQPYRRMSDVPEAQRSRFRLERGVPTDWSFIDRQVASAARNGIGVLPVVMIAPVWSNTGWGWTRPKSATAYARFVASLAGRFGPRGSFWTEHPEIPRMPLRDWQLWNEVDFRDYWADQPFERRYTRFLRAARIELRRVDPGARIVLAGFANFSWRMLERLYRSGARRYFDVAAIHPFTRQVEGVVEIVRRARRVMRRHGDARKPLMVTEATWTSGPRGHQSTSVSTEEGQAQLVSGLFRTLAARRRALRIERVYWLSWLSTDRDGRDIFNWAGLSRVRPDNAVERKPGYWSFRETARHLRGCESSAPCGR